MSKKREKLENWIKRKSRKTRKNLKTNVDRLYYQAIENKEKRLDLDNTRSIIRDNSSEDDNRKRKHQDNMQENNIETPQIFTRNTNKSEDNLYVKNIKEI